MNTRITAIIRKEFIHIIRDSRTLMITVALPLLMIFIYGSAIRLDISEIHLAVLDLNKTQDSRALLSRFTSSGNFILHSYIQDRDEIEPLFKSRKVKAVLAIPTDYSRQLRTTSRATVQVIIDGSNSNTGIVISNYINLILATYSAELNAQLVNQPISVTSRVWYNPDLESTYFVVPGLVAVILMMISALLTSITIAREKESGTMEQILVSPIRPTEIILGKVLPYVIIAFLDGALVLLAAWIGFGIKISGNVLLLALLSVVYLYASLAIGVFISTRVRTQQVAMMIALVATILPSILLSGFIFPIRSMPLLLRILSHIVPAKYFLTIIRGIVLKGLTFPGLWEPTLFLFVLGTLLLAVSINRFSTKLDT
ncbi:ABC transporter permease [candidate division KSB1 bacterium]|nr:ABC transporter permease [candidate division KSB1 bacterium]